MIGRRLAVFAVVMVIGHHTGTALAPLGEVGPTRWADWVDVLLPYALLGAAAWQLWSPPSPLECAERGPLNTRIPAV